MVRVLLGMDRKLPFDSADALACAICHIHTAQVEKRVAKTQQQADDRSV